LSPRVTPPDVAPSRSIGPGLAGIKIFVYISTVGMGKKIAVIAIVAVGVLLVIGLGGAVVCKKTDVDCHLNSPKAWTLQDAAGLRGGPQRLSSTLSKQLVVGKLAFPTDFDFLPNGRIVVGTKDGVVQIIDHGRVLRRPMLDLRGAVSTWELRGLMAVAVDTSTTPNHLYVAYSVIDPKHPDPGSGKPTTVRISRFTIQNDVAARSSEHVIVGRTTGGSCPAMPATKDCLPADRDHIGADIQIAKDGTLFISTGDGGPALANVVRAQNVDSLGGKILHVDKAGRGLPGNPSWNGDPNANRSKVWALGVRNPFRISLMPDGDVVAGDVGFDDVEEIDDIQPGGDYGWPCLEGTKRTPAFKDSAFCATYYVKRAASSRRPVFALPHDRWQSITAGTSLQSATELPEALRNKYLFGDWATSKVFVTDPPTRDEAVVSPSRLKVIARGMAGPVRFRVGPDGALYYLAVNTGELWRITARST
jgi:glucose/arabinose dehydrogenase